jgi:hypothetical protein
MGYAGYVPTPNGAEMPRRLSSGDRQDLMRRLGRNCAVCGSRENLHLYHQRPVAQGGANNIRNLEPPCERHRYSP